MDQDLLDSCVCAASMTIPSHQLLCGKWLELVLCWGRCLVPWDGMEEEVCVCVGGAHVAGG